MVCACWAGFAGSLIANRNELRVGIVQYFIKHPISVIDIATRAKRVVNHIFANVQWFYKHPRESWYPSPALVVSTDIDSCCPASFIRLSLYI